MGTLVKVTKDTSSEKCWGCQEPTPYRVYFKDMPPKPDTIMNDSPDYFAICPKDSCVAKFRKVLIGIWERHDYLDFDGSGQDPVHDPDP
jgi:hypothetical protein